MDRYLPGSLHRKISYTLNVLNDCFHRYIVGQCTEAVMSAIRAARGFTRRDDVIKFAGCHQGHRHDRRDRRNS